MVPDVFDTFWQQGPCYSEDFAFVMSKVDRSLQIRRARWVTAFPSFRELAHVPEMVTTLDSGKPMIPTIANYYGVSSGLIKRIKQLGEHTPADLGVSSGWALTKILARCNVNHIPNFSTNTSNEIAPFLAVAKATTTFVDSLGLPQRLAVELSSQLLKNVRGNWSHVSDSIGATDLSDIKDFVDSYADRSVLAAISQNADYSNILLAKEIFAGARNPREISLQLSENLNKASMIALSRALLILGFGDSWHIGTLVDSSNRWHKSFRNDEEKGLKHKFVAWPALCPEILAPNGCHLVPLTSSAELREEGIAMHHCVGGYVLNCQQRGSHIFSIRDQTGKRLSTLELRKGDSLEIIQNKGLQNTRPASMAQVAAKWLVEEIKHKRIEIDWKHLEKARLKAIQTSGIEDLLGFNPSDNLSWFRAFSEFSAFAPSNLRSSDPKKFVTRTISKIATKQFSFENMELEIIASLKAD
jgi:hypothetical protein